MNCRVRKLLRTVVCSLAVSATALVGTVWAGPVFVPKVPAHARPNNVVPQHKGLDRDTNLITTEAGEIEIVTDLAGKHYWQIPIRNTGQYEAKNFQVIVSVEGFRREDQVQTVGVIESLSPGETAYARAELPNFEGMHLMRVKTGGAVKTVEIPRPFRKDANGSPLSGLQLEDAWVHRVGGKIRWYFKTKPNLYDTISANSAQIGVYFRQRKHQYCHQEDFGRDKRVSYVDPASPVGGAVTNPKPIRPGESITLSGELNATTARPKVPQYVDQLIIEGITLNLKKVKPLDRTYYPASWQECN